MKRLVFLLCFLPVICIAQPGYINTVAGSGTNGFSGDGGPALLASLGRAYGVCTDIFGNVYIADDDNYRVRKLSPSGIMSTVAGGGNLTTDGILATNASINLNLTGEITTDHAGNLYLVDGNRIRKVDAITGIITTVAGSVTAGFSGDGGPAISAQLNFPHGICVDAAGNIYIGDEANNRIRKVNTSGIISTYAGTGIVGFSGDGGPATLAQLHTPDGICIDGTGNLYFADRDNQRIRKISPSGIITTYAGNGIDATTGDGGPATAASFSDAAHMCLDAFGNMYVSDFHAFRIRKIDQNGIVTAFAGAGQSLAENVPATSALISAAWGIGIDKDNNIYVPDEYHYKIRKITGIPSVPTASSNGFSAYVASLCAGPYITILPTNYSPSLSVKTYFGDGSSQIDTFTAFSGAVLNHSYAYPGVYTIKYVLFDGSFAIDSASSTYNYVSCQTISMQLYYDNNGNCIKDASENLLSQAVLIEVDSNNVSIDTFFASSGFYYNAYGAERDIYGFKVIEAPNGVYVNCPMNGVVYDTLGPLGVPNKVIGFQCGNSNNFDLSVHAIIPVTGVQDQWGDIYVQQYYCQPVNATLVLHYSPKYAGTPSQISPAAASVSANTITWNLNAFSSNDPGPAHFHYAIWSGAANLAIYDTVQSFFEITPIIGDSNVTDNELVIYDTVHGGCDPNEMWVTPDCISSAVDPVQLTYTINFENTGNDTAHNIYILDTLPGNVDVSTVKLVMSSHTMYSSKFKDAAGNNILKFDFPGANLLDSSHHDACNGGLVFTINTVPGLAAGTHVYNKAGIYFDVNDVVMTNRVDNLIGCFPSEVNNAVKGEAPDVYPNPATGIITIVADEKIFGSFCITNSIGQIVFTNNIVSRRTQADIGKLPQGLYFISIKGIDGDVRSKFVKL